MKLPALTQHAIDRAMLRWLEPTSGDAAAAIRYVLAHGAPDPDKPGTVYRFGSRCVRVVDGYAVTVFLHRQRRVRKLSRLTRQDQRERASRAGWLP